MKQDIGEYFSIIFQKEYMVLYIWFAYCLDVLSKMHTLEVDKISVAMLRRDGAFNMYGISKAYKDAICNAVISQTYPSLETEQRWPPFVPL